MKRDDVAMQQKFIRFRRAKHPIPDFSALFPCAQLNKLGTGMQKNVCHPIFFLSKQHTCSIYIFLKKSCN
jgi:hypothetical protein